MVRESSPRLGRWFISLATIAVLGSLIGCQGYEPFVLERSRANGIPVEKQAAIWDLLKRADHDEGLSDADWESLERHATDPNPKVRLEAVTVIGGISAKKTQQLDKVKDFLQRRLRDDDPEVKNLAKDLVQLYE